MSLTISHKKVPLSSLPQEAPVDVSPPKEADSEHLLSALKQKARLYKIMYEEGMIHTDRYDKISGELKQTIEELETLIPSLEVSDPRVSNPKDPNHVD